MYTCICLYLNDICIYVCVYICVYISIYICVYVLYIHACAYVYVYVCICIIYVCIHVYVCKKCIHICVYIYIHMYWTTHGSGSMPRATKKKRREKQLPVSQSTPQPRSQYDRAYKLGVFLLDALITIWPTRLLILRTQREDGSG